MDTTFLSKSTFLALWTRRSMLYSFEENTIIEVARVKSDLRRDGGSVPTI